ncbi:thiamine pyrophosphate-binding protein [SAR202 cluster bacterium AD-804-J14_MRT_500m]|nr:thiamine pyrophosphate-binding protein [SAR202 cluster bacterium AD-804-J14_MRT_500m]
MPNMSAGQAVVEILRAEGVAYIFGVVGSAFLEIMDPMYGLEDIKYVGTRHEQGAGFMALGYALASGRPGVCMVTNGPGATNMVTSIAGGYVTHAPMVTIIGGNSQEHIGRDSFQEIDHVGVFRSVTKESVLVPYASRIPDLLRQAFRTATAGKMGPVVVDIPRDIQNETNLNVDIPTPAKYRPPQLIPGDPTLIQRAANIIKKSIRPVIIAGGGVKWSSGNEEVCKLAELISAPIVTSYAQCDAVPNDHQLYVGSLGRAGAPEAAEVVQNSDVILAIGTRLSHFTTFYDNRYIPSNAKIIQIEIDQKELGRNFPVEVGILGDARIVTMSLTEAISRTGKPEGPEQRLNFAARLRETRRQRLDKEAPQAGTLLKPQHVYHELRKIYPADALTTLDAGAVSGIGYDRLNYSMNSLFSPLDLGCIGMSFPMALGVKMARPNRPVISINGDGGFLYNVQEIETAVRWKIPVVSIVMNNNSWASEKAYQKFFYGERYVEADITNPRLDKLMELFGGKGYFIDRIEDLGDALTDAIQSNTPSVIEIPVDPAELPFPARAMDVLKDKTPTFSE